MQPTRSFHKTGKTIKLHCCSSFPHVTGESGFHQQHCRGCFNTMHFYITTLISFGESSIISGEHEGRTAYGGTRMTKTMLDRNNSRSESPFYYRLVVSGMKKKYVSFSLPLPIMHTAGYGRAGMLVDTLSNIFRLKICTPQAKQREVFATGKIKDDTGNLYSVISWAR